MLLSLCGETSASRNIQPTFQTPHPILTPPFPAAPAASPVWPTRIWMRAHQWLWLTLRCAPMPANGRRLGSAISSLGPTPPGRVNSTAGIRSSSLAMVEFLEGGHVQCSVCRCTWYEDYWGVLQALKNYSLTDISEWKVLFFSDKKILCTLNFEFGKNIFMIFSQLFLMGGQAHTKCNSPIAFLIDLRLKNYSIA